ncbi:MAG: hypothetical protein L3K03_04190 [Thermoplasmata archaeon]|nr:hypothetical protein [Thermoplasmata archaeon]
MTAASRREPALLEETKPGKVPHMTLPHYYPVRRRPKLKPSVAATFAAYVDPARARAAVEGRTFVYTVHWS